MGEQLGAVPSVEARALRCYDIVTSGDAIAQVFVKLTLWVLSKFLKGDRRLSASTHNVFEKSIRTFVNGDLCGCYT